MAATNVIAEADNMTAIPSRPEALSGKAGASETSVDLLCVGFGLSSIAIAAALVESNPEGRVCFLEREASFSWTGGNILPNNKIRTPFLRDLATFRNPRSDFTFLNYLHRTDQLVAFTNASALCPSKLVMGQYVEWVAEQVAEQGWVKYQREVLRVEPVRDPMSKQVSKFAVHVKDTATGQRSLITSKRVIVATGSSPYIPRSLSGTELAAHIVHSSKCNELFAQKGASLPDVAVVGASQEGAEVYEHLQNHYGAHRATFFIEDSALRPVDSTAFSHTLVDVPHADLAAFPPELRARIVRGRHNQNIAPISLELIEHLYDMDYAQNIGENDPAKWRFQLEPLADVVGAELVNASARPRVRLQLKNPRTGETRKSERSFDVIVAATGSRKTADSLLGEISPLLEGGAISVGRDYRVNFRNGVLQRGCGLWSIGSLEEKQNHDEVFSHLAEQSQRVCESLVELLREEDKQSAQFEQLSML